MATNALYSPGHRVKNRTSPGNTGRPPRLAPSLDWCGNGFQDDRVQYNWYNGTYGLSALGWYQAGDIKTVSQVPSQVATANIAALQHVTSGTAMTLVSTTGAGITVVPANTFLCLPSGITIPSTSLAIDGTPSSGINLATSPPTPSYLRFGMTGTQDGTGYYDPTYGIGRAISITAAASATGGAITVRGYDWYGFAMTETITAVANTTVNGKKAWKFIVSATPAFTDGTYNYSIGTADIYGFAFATDYFSDVQIYWANTIQTSSTFTAAVSTQTATSGDTRGTFTPGSSSDGTKRLDILCTPSIVRVQAGTVWGSAQYAG